MYCKLNDNKFKPLERDIFKQSYGKQDQMFMDQFYISEPDYSLSKTSKLSYISVYDLMPYQVFQADMVTSNTVIFQNKTILLELSFSIRKKP